MSEIIATVSAKLIKSALKFAAKGDIRYYLNGVHIKPAADSGAMVCATNGHMLAMLHDPTGSAVVPCTIKRDVAAALPKTGQLYVYGDGSVTGGDTQWSYKDALIGDHKFPVVESVFPSAEGMTPGMKGSTFMGSYLREALDLFPAASGSMYTKGAISIYQKDELGALVLMSPLRDVVVLVMPMRDEMRYGMPSWIAKAKPAPQVKEESGVKL